MRLAILLSLLVTAQTAAQSASLRPRTYANPIDIDYRYNFEQQDQGISYRSGADPVIVVQRGEYYLFETIGDGYWRLRGPRSRQHNTPPPWAGGRPVAPPPPPARGTTFLLP